MKNGEFRCKCGQVHTIAPKSDGWTAKAQAVTMRGENAATLQTVPQPPPATPIQAGVYVETPIAQQGLESSVKVPLAQACISGVLFGATATFAWVFFGLPKPVIVSMASTLGFTWWDWRGGKDFAREILMRVEDYTGIDIDGDGDVGSEPEQPDKEAQPILRFVRVQSGYGVQAASAPDYEPEPTEVRVNIPDIPRAKEDPWTVKRLTDVLERAFATDRWGRAHCNELGMSQGQWSVLSKYLGPGEDGEGYNVWGTTDRPTLDAFVEQISAPVNQPTSQPTSQPEG